MTPTFSASYSGLFKMFFDVLDTGSPDPYADVSLERLLGTQRNA